MFQAGKGIRIEVCGHPLNKTVLIKFNSFSCIEFYQMSKPDSVLNSGLFFEEKGDIDEPLLRKLWLVRGCTSSTIELMMKHFKESSHRLNKELKRIRRDTAKKKEKANQQAAMEKEIGKNELIELMTKELTEERMFNFAKIVNNMKFIFSVRPSQVKYKAIMVKRRQIGAASVNGRR